MNARIKKRWVAALRSGKFLQGQGQLRETLLDEYGEPTGVAKYCCLGVLCELNRRSKDGEGRKWFDDRYLNCEEALPEKVADWADLPEANPTFIHRKKLLDLAGVNDSGSSFEQIADLIEKYL